MRDEFDKLKTLVTDTAPIIERDVQSSWGKPGEAGDPLQILRAVDRLASSCQQFIDWEIEVRSVAVVASFAPAIAAFQGIARSVLNNIISFPHELNRVVTGARAGVVNQKISLDFVTPPQIARAAAEIEKVSQW
jgi:hypothetical protein